MNATISFLNFHLIENNFILEKHFFAVVSAIILLDRNERTANSHVALTMSMLFCQNTVGSHTCSCKAGCTGNGKQCRGKNGLTCILKLTPLFFSSVGSN